MIWVQLYCSVLCVCLCVSCVNFGRLRNWETRRARASTRFFELANIWNDTSLSTETKLSLYRSLVVSVLIYGYEAWMLDATFLRSINSFNSRCLARITNREIRDEARDPTFDLRLTITLGYHMPLKVRYRILHVGFARSLYTQALLSLYKQSYRNGPGNFPSYTHNSIFPVTSFLFFMHALCAHAQIHR